MVSALKSVLGLLGINRPIIVYERVQDLAAIPEELLLRFGIDTRYVFPVAEETEIPEIGGFKDNWGVVRHRPKGVLYYEILRSPFSEIENEEQLFRIERPRPLQKDRQSKAVEAARGFRSSGYAVGTTVPGLFEQVMYLTGTEKFMVDMLCNQRLFLAYYARVLELLIDIYTPYLDLIGRYLELC